MADKFQIGDIVKEGGKVGIIIGEYRGPSAFDWEVAFITKGPTGCISDCCKSSHIEKYDWKPYPRTWKDIFNLIRNKLMKTEEKRNRMLKVANAIAEK